MLPSATRCWASNVDDPMYEASMLVRKHTKRLQGNRRQTEGHVENLSRYCYGGDWCLLKPCESYEGGGRRRRGGSVIEAVCVPGMENVFRPDRPRPSCEVDQKWARTGFVHRWDGGVFEMNCMSCHRPSIPIISQTRNRPISMTCGYVEPGGGLCVCACVLCF